MLLSPYRQVMLTLDSDASITRVHQIDSLSSSSKQCQDVEGKPWLGVNVSDVLKASDGFVAYCWKKLCPLNSTVVLLSWTSAEGLTIGATCHI